ncbi:MAG: hypothetical protein IKQ41_10250, partial [Clostridia bacterium]|nr:hypothetical protein [Clostridia bacterium]
EAPASFALSFQLASNCVSNPAEKVGFRTCLKNGICAGDTNYRVIFLLIGNSMQKYISKQKMVSCTQCLFSTDRDD